MKKERAFTLVEAMITLSILGAVGTILYSMFYTSTVLGAKNVATNTAHQQARTAMLQMVQDLHSAVSLPALVDAAGSPMPTPVAGASPSPAAGISFQIWSGGPYQVVSDQVATDTSVRIKMLTTATIPKDTQRFIMTSHRIESDISSVSTIGSSGAYTTYQLTFPSALGTAISGSGTSNYACFISDRCSYIVVNNQLMWSGPTARRNASVMGSDITSTNPFTMPTTAGGALYYRNVAAIDLTTSDLNYNNRGFKAANIMLNGQVPSRARLTTFQ